MPLLHDPQTRAAIRRRVGSLRPESRRHWGRMSVDQLDGPWPEHFSFRPATGTDCSRLQAKHLDHHLRQFST